MEIIEDEVVELYRKTHDEFCRSLGGRKLVHYFVGFEIVDETDYLSDSFVLAGAELHEKSVEIDGNKFLCQVRWVKIRIDCFI
jgi:hypothetical protein